MGLLMGQIILAARRTDGDESGWMQLVVFLILGVFWAVSGIIKARNEKEKQKKQIQREPVRQPQQRTAGRYKVIRQPEKKQIKPAIRPIVRESGAGSRPAIRPKSPYQPAAPAKKRPQTVEKKAIQVERAAKEPPIAKKTSELTVPAKAPLSLESTEQLQAAILHYEILGRCVALRESDEQTWMR